jgi:hypothetical protein
MSHNQTKTKLKVEVKSNSPLSQGVQTAEPGGLYSPALQPTGEPPLEQRLPAEHIVQDSAPLEL